MTWNQSWISYQILFVVVESFRCCKVPVFNSLSRSLSLSWHPTHRSTSKLLKGVLSCDKDTGDDGWLLLFSSASGVCWKWFAHVCVCVCVCACVRVCVCLCVYIYTQLFCSMNEWEKETEKRKKESQSIKLHLIHVQQVTPPECLLLDI